MAALLGEGEAPVKELRIDHDEVWLMPCNPAYPPIRLEDGGAILGKVFAVLRSL
ncbi:S24 family peptidase [Streptomyces sp. NPDC032161]|uniref:LexA family protein n=1 Tax=unclassified Streptomyces TaxID=2593676 RepID=UPI0033E786D6